MRIKGARYRFPALNDCEPRDDCGRRNSAVCSMVDVPLRPVWHFVPLSTISYHVSRTTQRRKDAIGPCTCSGRFCRPVGAGQPSTQKHGLPVGRDPKVRKAVESHRRRTIDQAIGRMTKQSTWAVDGIVAIAREADSDSVRLRAFRSIFSDLMAVSKHSGLEARIAELEEKVEEQRGAEDKTFEIRMTPGNGHVATLPAMRSEAGVALASD